MVPQKVISPQKIIAPQKIMAQQKIMERSFFFLLWRQFGLFHADRNKFATVVCSSDTKKELNFI